MPPSLTLTTSSADETRRVGEAVAGVLGAGDVVSLTGDLGAGKTTFVQGVARGLRVEGPVVSPTFTLVREYRGALPIYHLDVYRLDRVQDVLDLGFDEMLDERAVVLIEWGDVIEQLLPDTHLLVELEIPEDGDVRRLAITGSGRGWAERWEGLLKATGAWTRD